MNFRCTKKAQVRLRLTPSGLAPVPDMVSTVDWHCNVVTLGKRPFFLFAHSQSLYAFFVAAAGNSPLDAFGRAFRDQLAAALVREGVAADLGARLMDDGPDTICRAIDRRVLGTMNDHVNMSRFFVEDAGGLDDRVLAKIHDAINESPMSILGMESPRRVLLVSTGSRITAGRWVHWPDDRHRLCYRTSPGHRHRHPHLYRSPLLRIPVRSWAVGSRPQAC
jgi:hypothetical protein